MATGLTQVGATIPQRELSSLLDELDKLSVEFEQVSQGMLDRVRGSEPCDTNAKTDGTPPSSYLQRMASLLQLLRESRERFGSLEQLI